MTHIDEEELRRGLRELAGADGTAGAAPPTGGVVALGRRTRHRRRALAAGAATALVAAGSVLGVRWTGTVHGGAPAPAAPGVDDRVASRSAGGVRLESDVYVPQPPSGDGEPLDTGPREPDTEVRYRYDLSTACGTRYALFGGRVWEVDEGVERPDPNPVGDRVRGFMRWSDGFVTRGKPVVAIFETDGPDPVTTTYHPLTGTRTPSCLAQEPPRRYSDAPAATLGPSDPRPGVRYAHDWTRACDARYIVFGGRLWRTPGQFAPNALVSLVSNLPGPAFATLSADRRTVVLETRPVNDRDGRQQARYEYHPVDRPDPGDLDRCRSLADLQRLAQDPDPREAG